MSARQTHIEVIGVRRPSAAALTSQHQYTALRHQPPYLRVSCSAFSVQLPVLMFVNLYSAADFAPEKTAFVLVILRMGR